MARTLIISRLAEPEVRSVALREGERVRKAKLFVLQKAQEEVKRKAFPVKAEPVASSNLGTTAAEGGRGHGPFAHPVEDHLPSSF